jgi:hypothetical protein
MNPISKKLYDLEKNVIDDKPKTKTILYIDDPVEREIHRRAAAILSKQREIATELYNALKANPKAEINVNDLDLSSDEKAIVDKSNALCHYRIMELFDNAVAQFIHLNDPINKWIFYSRFNWFITEMQDWLYWLWRENQVYDTPGYFDMCAGEREKFYEPIRRNWRKWLTEDSWEKYYEDYPPKISQNVPELIPEELEEERKQIERDNAEEEAKEAKFLAERCPSCKEKCKWYYEQIGEKKMSLNAPKNELIKK